MINWKLPVMPFGHLNRLIWKAILLTKTSDSFLILIAGLLNENGNGSKQDTEVIQFILAEHQSWGETEQKLLLVYGTVMFVV